MTSSVIDKLTEAGIEFTTEDFFSGFWGTRIIVSGRRTAEKASKLVGYEFIKRRDGKWQLEIF